MNPSDKDILEIVKCFIPDVTEPDGWVEPRSVSAQEFCEALRALFKAKKIDKFRTSLAAKFMLPIIEDMEETPKDLGFDKALVKGADLALHAADVLIQRSFKDGKIHREDGPATEYANGDKYWYKDGKCHRDDGPAAEYADGTKKWYKDGGLHRDDGPAAEYADGTKKWYKDGVLHRDDGPAVEFADGSKYWFKDGKCHRDDGPAAEYADGAKYWYKDGKYHRDDGPAIEYANGDKCWYLNGIFVGAWYSETKKHGWNGYKKLTEEEIDKWKKAPLQ